MRATGHPKEQQATFRRTATLRSHPQADLVPATSDAEYRAFRDDIAVRGVLVPLEITAAGVVVDGHQRLRAAHELQLSQLPVRVVAHDLDLVEYMLVAALHRRHLTPSQRAILALDLSSYQDARQAASRRKRANLRNATVDVAALPHRTGRSRELAAGLANVSPRLIQNAIAVRERAPEL